MSKVGGGIHDAEFDNTLPPKAVVKSEKETARIKLRAFLAKPYRKTVLYYLIIVYGLSIGFLIASPLIPRYRTSIEVVCGIAMAMGILSFMGFGTPGGVITFKGPLLPLQTAKRTFAEIRQIIIEEAWPDVVALFNPGRSNAIQLRKKTTTKQRGLHRAQDQMAHKVLISSDG